MKKVILYALLPFVLSLICVYCIALSKKANSVLFPQFVAEKQTNLQLNFIENFQLHPEYENLFLKSGDSSEIIYLLGSSELVTASPAIPYNFISKHFSTQVIGLGHAGNQCFSIYSQLLANVERLDKTPIVIILSPGWFESKPSKGTGSAIFLEYNSQHFLSKILRSNSDDEFHRYYNQGIAKLYSDFNSPLLELKLMNYKHLASSSFMHNALYSPLIFCDKQLLLLKEKIVPEHFADNKSLQRFPIAAETLRLNWDSLSNATKELVLQKSTNNNMAIADEYYTEYIHGKTGKNYPVSEKYNQELSDFKMLMKLLKKKGAHASFIISPLNPLYYKNSNSLLPTLALIENEINACEFSCLNLFESDTAKYDRALLHDVMHLSDYGWYKVDKFISKTYKLEK